ncbi:PAS domain S-box-containing protein [Alkalispirochaeta americana]|uniref:histidine kinase n=1 Tax=Alkalispirochaeta americana TaxID=159291 RepID=A0A1N6NZ06_9SPIO|nr:response regulator [Alkalispirochaeta americana]SIP97378.1 PAS domain S-box-containing protein [Alkalispirochaeta americana]
MEDHSGRRFQVVFEHSPIGLVIMDGSGRIEYANQAVRTFLGCDEKDLAGGFLTAYSHWDDSDFFQTLFSELLEGDRDSFQVVSRCRPRNQQEAWWRVDIRAVHAPGQDPFLLGVIDDVTSQKNDEERLRRGKETAEAATRTKSAFLANMSHEIRTPLHTINAVSELLRETNLDEEQIEYLQQVLFAGDVLLGLINDILDFSKIEAGRLQLESIVYDPVKTIEDAVDMVSMQAHRKGLEVILAVEQGIPQTVRGDPARLRQVLVNLVNNATKFTERGYIRISAERRAVSEGDVLLVQVRDTGIGIDPSRQDRLFKPFSQVDASMTRKFGGTGLGLSISRDLVGMMGGRIGVKSRPEVGSNFWFSLPLDVVEEGSADHAVPGNLPPGSGALIVDDNPESVRVIGRVLASWGMKSRAASSGAEGIAALREASRSGSIFSFVLVDLMLSDMDGWQLASEVRNDERIEAMPLILMTPTGMSTGEAKMKLLHWFDGYISKPVKKGLLSQTVSEVLSGGLEELQEVSEEDLRQENSPKQRSTSLPETVLIAEDHFVNQQLFQTILEKRGFRTILAADGVEAVRCVQEFSGIGLIFMDVQMPNMNGYDATIRIREMGFSTPIVAVTANALAGDRDRCVRVGMDDYMTKPFKKSDIDDVLLRLQEKGFFSSAPDSVEEIAGGGFVEDALDLEELESPEGDPIMDEAEAVGGVEEVEGNPIDYAAAVEAFMGDEATAQRVIRQFSERLPGQIEKIREDLRESRFEEARITAHAIKGGAWNLSCSDLGDAARQLEEACAGKNRDQAEIDLPGVQKQVGRFVRYVEEENFSSSL